MAQLSIKIIDEYINKLRMLERRVGAKTKYRMLQPFPLNPKDIITIQNAAKTIALFIGLKGLTFVVSIVKQKEKVGGNVELRQGQTEVFIEISDDVAKFDDTILATLAHEITHKYLHTNDVSVGAGPFYQYENEVLTDIAAVFLGLGKLLLNGSQVEKRRQHAGVDGTHYTTESLRSGYLDWWQLAFVYRVVCAMRGISDQDMTSGLSARALSVVRACGSYEQDYFNPQFRTEQYLDELINIVREDIQTLEHELNQVSQHLEFLKQTHIYKTEQFLEEKRKIIASLRDGLRTVGQGNIYDPCLLFLDTIELKKRLEQMDIRVKQESSDSIQVRQSLNQLTKLDQEIEPKKPRKKPFLSRILPRSYSIERVVDDSRKP